jgi:hypothetical protein
MDNLWNYAAEESYEYRLAICGEYYSFIFTIWANWMK